MATFTAKRKIVKEAGKVRACPAAVDAGLRVLGLGAPAAGAPRGPRRMLRAAGTALDASASRCWAGCSARSGAFRGTGCT